MEESTQAEADQDFEELMKAIKKEGKSALAY